MIKAYSALQIKTASETSGERLFKGIASTPTTDRDDDILEPQGATFALPIPLLFHHNHSQPIGEVLTAQVTSKGIEITAKIAQIDEAGKLKERLDEAWHSIKSGLIKGLSVGFKIKDYSYIEDSWGLHIKSWEFYELSVVTVPANADAVITSVKSIKAAFARDPHPFPPNLPPLPISEIPPPVNSCGAVLLLPTQGVTLL